MDIDLDGRRVRMGVGDLADFTLGPRDAGEGPAGIWRAQLGSHWHRELRAQATVATPGAQFEVAIEGVLETGRWHIALGGRVDQLFPAADGGPSLVREIKSVIRPLPEGEAVLRRDYPGYFVQLAAYLRLLGHARGELLFVEASTGLTQTVAAAPGDQALLAGQLARVAEFLDLRWRARERLRHLNFHAPFATLRPGQETAAPELAARAEEGRPVLLEAPTGFGKTGVLLEFALGALRAGRFERAVYLTGKATGQIQVMRTLGTMAPPAGAGGPAAWVVRPKSEHCVNRVFHCVREDCKFLDDVESRWNASGLARFYLFDDQPRDLPSLRAAGLDVRICPYEITRASLPFNDVWIGDYNYVFAPGSRGLFYRQPGFAPGRSLLIVDEAHNLPSRVADAYSHELRGKEVQEAGVLLGMAHPGSALASWWGQWTDFLLAQVPCALLDPDEEARGRELIRRLGELIRESPIDYASLSPRATEVLWELPALAAELEENALPHLWWCRRAGELALTCIDAAPAIGAAIGEYGAVVLATATPGPLADFAAALGWSGPAAPPPAERLPERLGSLTKRDTRKLARQISSGAGLLRIAEERAAPIGLVRAHTPWRVGAYDIAFDERVDTTFQHRSRFAGTTAATIAALARSAGAAPAAVFFPSFAYAELIREELAARFPALRAEIQPRNLDLAGQTAWLEANLPAPGALLLILGSGFAESVDLLGGRIQRAMVVGPALPEVNAVQRARLAAFAPLGRDTAVRRTYQIPGMQKVNQALGRLVRAPGQTARVLLHCQRFSQAEYRELLAEDYRQGKTLETDDDLSDWLEVEIEGT